MEMMMMEMMTKGLLIDFMKKDNKILEFDTKMTSLRLQDVMFCLQLYDQG